MTQPTPVPLSSRARVALAIARGVAASVGHRDLRPSHVAIGLLREAENPAVAALHAAGISLHALRRELEVALEPRGGTNPTEVAIPLTQGEEQLVMAALDEARQRQDEFLGPQHLLLALLRDSAEPVAQFFARYGMDYSSATTHLKAVLHQHK